MRKRRTRSLNRFQALEGLVEEHHTGPMQRTQAEPLDLLALAALALIVSGIGPTDRLIPKVIDIHPFDGSK